MIASYFENVLSIPFGKKTINELKEKPLSWVVLIPGQLRIDSFLRRGGESSRSGTEILDLCFPTQRCPDGLSGHALQSPSQTLGRMETFRERERKIESGFENSLSPFVILP